MTDKVIALKKILILKQKNLLNIVMILFLFISFSANALTMKEKIQQDLSKMGMNETIISETINLYMAYSENDIKVLDIETENKLRNILKKDERNFYLLEILVKHYIEKGIFLEEKSNKKNIQKYFDLYKKYSLYNYSKYFYEIYTPNYNRIAFQKMKQEYSGTVFEKIAEIWEELVGSIEKTGLTERESKLIEEILVEIEEKEIQEKFRLSEEEVFDLKIVMQLVKIQNYFHKKEYEKGIDYYLSIESTKNEKFKKYKLFNQKIIWRIVASKVGELETLEKAMEKIEKLENLEIYKEIPNY